jgi:hypothetical protein
MSGLYAPQMVIRSRMLYFTWVPADTDAVRALVPAELELADNAQCFINQYVVDSADDASGFEPYSLTYAGLDVKGQDSPQGIPGRWWTHYINSNADMTAYAAAFTQGCELGEFTPSRRAGIAIAQGRCDKSGIGLGPGSVGDRGRRLLRKIQPGTQGRLAQDIATR